MENMSKNRKLRADFLLVCKITVISITGVQSIDVEGGFVYTLPARSLFAFFQVERDFKVEAPWTLGLDCPFPPALWAAQPGRQKRHGAAPQRAVPTLFCMDYSPRRDTRGVLPCIAHVAPATAWPRALRPHRAGAVYLPRGKDAPTLPQPLGCNSHDQIPTAKAHRLSTPSAMSPIHKRDMKGFNFALTNLSLASNYRTGGLC